MENFCFQSKIKISVMCIRRKGKLFHCQHGNSKDRDKYYKPLHF